MHVHRDTPTHAHTCTQTLHHTHTHSQCVNIMAHIQSPRFDGEDQQNLLGCGVCIDPEYNVLWSFSPCSGEVSCFNPIAADIEGRSFGRSCDTNGMSCDTDGWSCDTDGRSCVTDGRSCDIRGGLFDIVNVVESRHCMILIYLYTDLRYEIFPPPFPPDSSGTILSTSICLPRSKEAHTSRSHMALNLLSCMSTLATCPPLTIEALAGSRMRKYDKEEFNCIVRFNGKAPPGQ